VLNFHAITLIHKYRPQNLGHGFEALTLALRFVVLALRVMALALSILALVLALALILPTLFPSPGAVLGKNILVGLAPHHLGGNNG